MPKELKQAQKALKEAGYYKARQKGSHIIYVNDELQTAIPLMCHNVTKDTVRYIKKQIASQKKAKT